MYLRAAHGEPHIPTLQAFIQENALGLFITALPNSPSNHPTIQATHIPWLIDIPKDDTQSNDTDKDDKPRNLGTLRGHLARQNPHAKALIEAVASTSSSPTAEDQEQQPNTLPTEISIIFTSPQTHYITPKYYVSTKPSTGKVVPTWNYAAVQVYGTAKIHHGVKSPSAQRFLEKQIFDLSHHLETQHLSQSNASDQAKPWKVSDAPRPFIDILQKTIVGVEVEITRLEGKWKMSQELVKEEDRIGVVEGLKALGTDGAKNVAGMVEERGRRNEEGKPVR